MRAPKSTESVCVNPHLVESVAEPVVEEAPAVLEVAEPEESGQSRSDVAIERMGGYLLRGFIMLNSTCPRDECHVC